mmetsp:Transcript_22857/g.91474  ORF Transcript_22857/g.91474 Transcript_22857/m.91474 type:complete len:232 (-) Transcript_22857:726-1421(-)
MRGSCKKSTGLCNDVDMPPDTVFRKIKAKRLPDLRSHLQVELAIQLTGKSSSNIKKIELAYPKSAGRIENCPCIRNCQFVHARICASRADVEGDPHAVQLQILSVPQDLLCSFRSKSELRAEPTNRSGIVSRYAQHKFRLWIERFDLVEFWFVIKSHHSDAVFSSPPNVVYFLARVCKNDSIAAYAQFYDRAHFGERCAVKVAAQFAKNEQQVWIRVALHCVERSNRWQLS